MELYIVRHGNTPYPIRDEQRVDPPLTELGEKQALSLAQHLQDVHFDRIFASPLQRCVQTAAKVSGMQQKPVELVTAMLEKGTKASYTGLPFDALRRICPLLQENQFSVFADGLPEIESDIQALDRAKQVIGYIRSTCSAESTVLLVAHGTFNNFLIHAALDFPLKENFNFSQDNTGLTLVRYLNADGKPRTKLSFMNDTTHLKDLSV